MRDLNVFAYGFMPWRHPGNWVSNIRQFFRNLKYGWQRATKGYCDYDLWSLDSFYQRMFRDSLRDYTKCLHGAPIEFYDAENDSIDSWVDYVLSAAQHFENSIEGYENPIDYDFSIHVDKDGNWTKLDADQQELGKRWFKEECKIEQWKESELHLGIEMIDTVFFNLWD